MQTLPEKLALCYRDHACRYNGLHVEVLKKEHHVLLKFNLSEPRPSREPEGKRERQAEDLIKKLEQDKRFALVPTDDVPEAKYFAPDISNEERENALFIAPVAGRSLDTTYAAVILALRQRGEFRQDPAPFSR